MVVTHCEALVCCAWTVSDVKVISWGGREVYMLEGLPSSPEQCDLLSGSLTGTCITCTHVVVHYLCWVGGGVGGSINPE